MAARPWPTDQLPACADPRVEHHRDQSHQGLGGEVGPRRPAPQDLPLHQGATYTSFSLIEGGAAVLGTGIGLLALLVPIAAVLSDREPPTGRPPISAVQAPKAPSTHGPAHPAGLP